MGYFSWGEQIGNSFMNMYAQNQQKRLEEARMNLEQKRLNAANNQWQRSYDTANSQWKQTYDMTAAQNAADNEYRNTVFNTQTGQWEKTFAQNVDKNKFDQDMSLKTFGLQEKTFEDQALTNAQDRDLKKMQMEEIADENAAYASAPMQWVDFNGNKVQDADEMVSAKYFDKFKDLGYSNLSVPVVDQDTGRISTNEQYLPMYRQESEWNQGSALATLMNSQFNSTADRNLTMRGQDINHADNMAQIGATGAANRESNSILRQQNITATNQMLQTALSNSMSELNQYGYSDANMNFVPYKGQKENYEKFVKNTVKQLGGAISREDVEYNINSAMHNAARGAKTTPVGSTTKYTLAKDATPSGTKLPANSMKVSITKAIKMPNLKVDPNGWAYVEQNGRKVWVVDANNNLVKGALLKTGSK